MLYRVPCPPCADIPVECEQSFAESVCGLCSTLSGADAFRVAMRSDSGELLSFDVADTSGDLGLAADLVTDAWVALTLSVGNLSHTRATDSRPQ